MSDTDWRKMQKSYFSGRGRVWVYLKTSEILSTIHEYDEYDMSNYVNCIEKKGKAWVRYLGPGLSKKNRKKIAKFEIRFQGSKVPQNDVYHEICHEWLLENIDQIERLEDGKTPFNLGLEDFENAETTTIKKVKSSKQIVSKVKNKDIKLKSNVTIKESDIPASRDPKEWEEFLLKIKES